mgnify:CR=1 FL=1
MSVFSVGSKVVSKSHGIPGVVKDIKKYGGYEFLIVKVSGKRQIEGALLTTIYGKEHEFEAHQ